MTTAITQLGYSGLPRLMEAMTGDEKHSPASTSTLDVVWVLYDSILDVDPHAPDAPDRDRFLLSKGHGPMAFYAVLAAKGFFDASWLSEFGAFDSPLGHHPDRLLVPGVEISSGSLGHGLPLGVGCALGMKAKGRAGRVVVLVGDAELDEGSNQEAISFAGRVGLGSLSVVVIDNGSSTWGGSIPDRFVAAGWTSVTVDGRDHDAIRTAFDHPRPGRPHVVVAVVDSKG